MKKRNSWNYFIPATLFFIGLPVLLWSTGDYPRRTQLKEAFSILALVSYGLLLGQFFLARTNQSAVRTMGAAGVIKYHKIIGYAAVAVLLTHPFLIVLPRYYESGIDPIAAFVIMVTEFESTGVLLGLGAWALMVILGITSMIRGSLPMGQKTWKIFHGILSGLFIVMATWHALDLGRHTNTAASIVFIVIAAGGIALLLKSYLPKTPRKEQNHG